MFANRLRTEVVKRALLIGVIFLNTLKSSTPILVPVHFPADHSPCNGIFPGIPGLRG